MFGRVVFTNGCFDVLHRGHIELLRYCHSIGDMIIVGLNSDESVKNLKGKTTGLMMEGSVAYMESNEQERKNLINDMPLKMEHGDSPAEFTGMSGGSALHQEEKKETKKDSVSSKEDKDLKMMKKLQGLDIKFDSGKEKPKEQIKKQLEK